MSKATHEHARVLVLGRSGQLARHLQLLMPQATYWDRGQADLAHPERLQSLIESFAPSSIINAAAHTAVDKAESERELAWRVNAESPAAMARAAASAGVPLVHVSTDYVFDGSGERAYRESDPVSPQNVYGLSKLGGELAVRALAPRHWILRTSWVFSEFGHNFVKTMVRLGKDRPELKVVNDQRGRPTYAGDLARLIVALVTNPDSVASGTYHAGGPSREGNGPVSWCEFAGVILAKAQARGLIAKQPALTGIPTSQYPTPARRPANSVLEPNAALHSGTAVGFDWQRGLDGVLEFLAANP
jgi:dTDP-4-dehydrorhamnose reductase